MSTRIKVCGITRAEDARLAVELGASALGFNFYRPSPRYITPAAAWRIVRQLPVTVTAVGVFADETDGEYVAGVAREAGVSAVQLHGPKFPASNGGGSLATYPLIRAVAVGDGFRPEELANLEASAFLLDAYDSSLRGGTGKTVDWSRVREAKNFGMIYLAGGLKPENVAQAIREVQPFAVDVASGVESAPGVKDEEKLRAFFAAVKKTDEEMSH